MMEPVYELRAVSQRLVILKECEDVENHAAEEYIDEAIRSLDAAIQDVSRGE